MAMEPWRFTIEFDDEKAKRNGYNVDDLYDCVGKYAEQMGNVRIGLGTCQTDASTPGGGDSAAVAALIEQLAKKDEQIAKLMETVADSTKAVQGAQALHHETAQTLALESTEQKLSRWQRLKRAWRC